MFQFPGFPTYTYVFSSSSMILHHGCSHIRTSPDQCLFAAPRSFSQLVTSFVGSRCQGILHMLFYAWTTFRNIVWYSAVLCLNCYVFVHFFFTVTLANVYISSDEILVFVTCFYFGKTWFISNFPYFSLSCTLIRFSMSIQALSFVRLYNYLNLFKSL